nr:VOC family protein [uncultured Friedmanniella sp.]
MHRILLREVLIDVPSSALDATRTFWAAALLARPHVVEKYPQFTSLRDPAALPHVGLQDLGDGTTARYHLDLETDDVEAEVARLVSLGATEVSRQDGLVVLQDPAGLLLCVLPPESEEFATRSREVE